MWTAISLKIHLRSRLKNLFVVTTMQYSLRSNRHRFMLIGFHATISGYPVQSFQLHATTKCIGSREKSSFWQSYEEASSSREKQPSVKRLEVTQL